MPELRLTELVQRVDQDRLVIPDFQRGFKWQTSDIRKLLESLLLDFPIGAALLWRTQRAMLEFRRIEDVQFADDGDDAETTRETLEAPQPEEIDFILDGQQRITSIYKLFPRTLAPSDHELESRFKGLRFFLDVERLGLPREIADLSRTDYSACKDPDKVAGAIVEKRHSDLRKEYRSLTGSAPQRLSDEQILDICVRKRWLPLTRAFLENKQSHLQRLRREVEAALKNKIELHQGTESRDVLSKLVDSGLDRWSDWFTSVFQATLNAKTLTCLIHGNEQPEGLARIFETINSTGMSLSVFDLLVARLGRFQNDAGATTNLRTLVFDCVDKDLLKRFDDERALGGTASQQFPRLLALRAGIELKKGEILKAPKQLFIDVVNVGGAGLACALKTLDLTMGVIDQSCLPVKDLIALAGATFASNTTKWETIKDRVIAYLWTICLIDDWDSSTNDTTRATFRRLQDVLEGRLSGEEIVARLEAEFPDFEQVRDAASKSSLIYRTLMAFNLSRGGVDWERKDRSPAVALEDHHIFAKDWVANNRMQSEDKQMWASLRDSVLNRMYVSVEANGKAKALTPPTYLSRLTASERRILQVPESFLGPLQTPIKSDDFAAFLKDRYDLIRTDFIGTVRTGLLPKV